MRRLLPSLASPLSLLIGVHLWLLPPRPAAADPLDAFGFGPRAAAMGTAGIAAAEPLEAAVANAAAAPLGPTPTIGLGWLLAVPDVTLDGRDADVDAAHGVLLGAAVPFRLAGIDLGAAVALHVPDRFLARVGVLEATQPRLVRWDNWIHRVSATAVVAADIGGGFSLGAGATILADAAASGRVDLGARAGESWATADIDLEMPLRAAPVVGLLFRPVPYLAFGVTFRGSLAMHADLSLRADADFADESLAGSAVTRLEGTSCFSPRILGFGAALRLAGWTVAADVAWRNWSDLEPPVADVDAAIALGAPAPIAHRLVPRAAWTDTVVPAIGVEYALAPAPHHRLALRAGYAWEPSPVPPQTGLTNLADPERHLASLGIGWRMELDRPGAAGDDGERPPIALDLGLALQMHRLVPFETAKEVPEFAGGPLSAGGWVWAGQLWIGVTL